jgi:hypothetical protein
VGGNNCFVWSFNPIMSQKPENVKVPEGASSAAPAGSPMGSPMYSPKVEILNAGSIKRKHTRILVTGGAGFIGSHLIER